MTYTEQQRLLAEVSKAVQDEPELFKEIVNACSYGVTKAIKQERQRAADMETIAVAFQAMSNGRYRKNTAKWIEDLVPAKLNAWKGKLSFNWDLDDIKDEESQEKD